MDAFGDRMKSYESRETSRRFLPYLPIYVRIDGRSFSNFTKDFERPFDSEFNSMMVEVTKELVKQSHAVVGYTQSDEISLLFYAPDVKSQIFFDGKAMKLSSVLASIVTSKLMMELAEKRPHKMKELPCFDARVFELPNKTEAANAILWREMDATKNAISMATRHHFSHKQVHGKNRQQMQEMLSRIGNDIFNLPVSFTRGTFVRRRVHDVHLSEDEMAHIPVANRPDGPVKRSFLESFHLPSLASIENRNDVIFDDAEPITRQEKKV